MRNKKIGRRGLNPIFLFFFCQYTVQMIDGGGGGKYDIIELKIDMLNIL